MWVVFVKTMPQWWKTDYRFSNLWAWWTVRVWLVIRGYRIWLVFGILSGYVIFFILKPQWSVRFVEGILNNRVRNKSNRTNANTRGHNPPRHRIWKSVHTCWLARRPRIYLLIPLALKSWTCSLGKLNLIRVR